MNKEFIFQGERAIADPIVDGQLAQDPMVTQLVLGQPQFMPLPGETLLPTIMVDSWVYKYTVYNNEHLQDHDTKGLEIQILDPASATRFTLSRLKDGNDTISVTGNVIFSV